MITKRPRGTNDILPGEVEAWQFIEKTARNLCREYGYKEIRTPIFEHTELFYRGVGDTTDIVEKEMYDFKDKGGRSLTLRPEGTAPVVRAFLENKLYSESQPIKLYYIGPMFRYGRPQAGRLRQFHQFGIEVFGSKDPAVDAEIISLAVDFYKRLGMKAFDVQINSVGCSRCRPKVKERLHEYLIAYKGELCETCLGRLERNPLRIFDCKSKVCQRIMSSAPKPLDFLCDECREHFDKVKNYLDVLEINYSVNPGLVRGLDYYTNTAFEFFAEGIGAQNSIGGGGRYDNLVETCGGPATPGIGFGLGLERTLMALQSQKVELPLDRSPDVFVAVADKNSDFAVNEAVRILAILRREGFSAEKDYMQRSLRAQMKYADKKDFKFAVIIGEEELNRGSILIRNMKNGEQQEIPKAEMVEKIKMLIEGEK
ncbi:MAG: Histidine--tRNA ligase [Clostridia bacterium 41_269]|nr:MAG: Histidine--tRNA ligase [Clostridia bacterium 41_269]